MDKHPPRHNQVNGKSPSFVDFWQSVADEIGSHKLDLNPRATSVEQLFAPGSVHATYLKKLILESLGDKSGKLTQPIDLIALLDQLGEVAFTLRIRSEDDLFDIELLEEIAWILGHKYGHLIPHQDLMLHDDDANKNSGTLVSLNRYKAKARRNQKP